MPQLPTFGEAGFKNYEAALWYSLLAPAKTPKPVIDKLNAAVVEALKTPEVQSRLAKQGFETRSPRRPSSKQLLEQGPAALGTPGQRTQAQDRAMSAGAAMQLDNPLLEHLGMQLVEWRPGPMHAWRSRSRRGISTARPACKAA